MICNVAGQSPEIIELMITSLGDISKEINREDLSAADQLIYDEYAARYASKLQVCINNYEDDISVARYTSDPITEDTEVADYATLSPEDQAVITEYIQLFNSL